MSKAAPYMKLYPSDWIESEEIFDMTLEEEGAYFRLLCAMWTRGGTLRDEPRFISNILRCSQQKWRKIRTVLTEKYGVIEAKNGLLSNERLGKELVLLKEKSEKSSRSVRSRWEKRDELNKKKPNKNNDGTDTNVIRERYHTDTDTDIKKEVTNVTSKESRPSPPPKRAVKKAAKKSPVFRRPTVDQIRDYCQKRQNGIDPQDFFDHYESRGWVVGKTKTPMKSWEATVRTWENQRKKRQAQQASQPASDNQKQERYGSTWTMDDVKEVAFLHNLTPEEYIQREGIIVAGYNDQQENQPCKTIQACQT